MRNHSCATSVRRVAPTAWRVAVLASCLAVALAGCSGSKKQTATSTLAVPSSSGSDAVAAQSPPTQPPNAQSPNAQSSNAQSSGTDVPGADFLGAGVGDADSAGVKLCALFTVAEISKVVGASVDDGQVGGPQRSLCKWTAGENGGSALLQLATSDDWGPPELADGYRTLPGIGDEAYAAPGITGWDAGALAGDKVVIASVWDGSDSGDSSADPAIELLKEALARLS